ncbi:hypothetical protein RV14_GL002186 [Enterococcus ratti]|uniref:Uncharacterized protein n=1 Tax=Enterococcus ratti TaxID=150033 RepID=A0A1L8WNJ5_9ENTE|nr:hypothetical protein RV14_GL002186 [Enterococcus ratti]
MLSTIQMAPKACLTRSFLFFASIPGKAVAYYDNERLLNKVTGAAND